MKTTMLLMGGMSVVIGIFMGNHAVIIIGQIWTVGYILYGKIEEK